MTTQLSGIPKLSKCPKHSMKEKCRVYVSIPWSAMIEKIALKKLFFKAIFQRQDIHKLKTTNNTRRSGNRGEGA